ncbi:MAG: beta-mannosidase [Acidimicrobiaceae bacterium]|nr:beta-mannosidase [Acidimicrobiaceae bacterium]
MDLGGAWRAIAADETLRRTFSDPEFDVADWAEIVVPHHWRSHPGFAASDGPLLYRRRFDSPATRDESKPGWRTWLQLDGLFYQGDVWLDGSYLGDTEGYFFPNTFEITEAAAQRSEHLLALELTCDRPSDKTAKRNLTGVFQHWDCIDSDWNPGGIWRPVTLFETGPVRVAKLRVLCTDANEERATLEFRATLDVAQAALVRVTTTVSGPRGPAVERSAEHPLAAGANELRWRVPIEQPDLWWPHALGDQPLYDVTVTASLGRDDGRGGDGAGAGAGAVSDQRTIRTGLRQVRMRNFIATVNGERLFLKGSNLGPTKRELGEATPEQLERDVTLARDAGLDLLRVHGHISRPELYDAADRLGVLLWQDLPLQWRYARVRKQAVRQAEEAVDLLGHHPSVAVWCGHNEPVAVEHPSRTVKVLARQVLPTWNKSVLDRSIHRALEKADGSRPVVAHSGVLPHPAWGTDSHLYYGWYVGEERELPEVLARFPVLARFVSEFGAQSVPDDAPWCQPSLWPDLDWEHLERAYCLQKAQFDRHLPPSAFATFDQWREATQAYQAQIIRYHVETLRRLKYRPTGGFCQFMLGDGQPAVSWSVLDDQRRPKAGWSTLKAACEPVIVVADRPAASYRPGDDIHLAVHVVSDLRAPITDAACRAVLSWTGGRRTWRFTGPVDPDSCARVGFVHLAAPDSPGPVQLDLDLTWEGGAAHNHYASQIAR